MNGSSSSRSRRSSMKSRKRAFEGSGAIDLEMEVVEVSSEDSDFETKKPAKGKGKQVMVQDVIDVDNDGCLPDMVNKVKLGGNYKRKDLIYVSDGNDSDDNKASYFKGQSASSITDAAKVMMNANNLNKLSNVSSHAYQNGYNYFYQDDDLEFLPENWSGMDELSYMQAQFEKADIPTGIEAFLPWWSEPGQNNGQPINFSGPSNSTQPIVGSGLKQMTQSHGTTPVEGTGFNYMNESKSTPPKLGSLPDNHLACSSYVDVVAPTILSEGSSRTLSESNLHEEAMKRLQQFENFALVDNYSDHHYANTSLKTQPQRAWTKKVQDEWKILQSSLPDTIFVRAYESKMDLLRAVIIGPQGTPYHDGVFFFDVLFPSTYPNGPPRVYYHSGGLRLNPNLYNCGKVCLSLLGTWSGRSATENWIPGKSTLLQVLVSIQALILNAKPYFNEPGYADYEGSTRGEKASEKYNEETLIKSLKTMLYSMRRPPKHFEGFVSDHFITRSHDILLACKAYMDGSQVGSVSVMEGKAVRGNEKSCSSMLRGNVGMILNSLVDEFSKLGVKNCDGYRIPESKNMEPPPPVSSGISLSLKSQSQNNLNSSKAKVSKAKLKRGSSYKPAPFPPAAYPIPVPPVAWNSSSLLHASPPAVMFNLPQPTVPNGLGSHPSSLYNYPMPIPSNPDLTGNVFKWSNV
ncbi:unnamed protein product [Rhodiola kirilowii]